MRRSPRLPKRFPVGTKYILESYGGFVRRYIEYPSGRRIELEPVRLFPVAASTAVLCQSVVLTPSIQSLKSSKRSLISLLGRTRERKNGYGLIPSEATSDWAYFIGSAPGWCHRHSRCTPLDCSASCTTATPKRNLLIAHAFHTREVEALRTVRCVANNIFVSDMTLTHGGPLRGRRSFVAGSQLSGRC